MFYKLAFDTDYIDESIKKGSNMIYAEATNMDEISYKDIKKGFFDNIIFTPRIIDKWPDVEFYYSSRVSVLESDYLMNIKRWPIVHTRVTETFTETGIKGIQYFPVKLVDVITQEINQNYVLMYIENFIDAFDMKRSKYKYNEKYDFYTFLPKETYLDRSLCNAYDIFRCSKSVASIYVSEKIKKIIEDNCWTGFKLYEQP